ncbi:MAG TPA: hypothetical protein VD866_01550 [Urbifossiella sp.]|nr:hypothetical protein [Urbifossiella sp.]
MAHVSGNTPWVDSPAGQVITATRLNALEAPYDQLRTSNFGGLTRTRWPECRAEFAGTFPLTAAAGDVFAQGGWTATLDTDSGFVPGSTGVPAYYQIPFTGLWDVGVYMPTINLPINTTWAIKLVYGTANVITNSLASDAVTCLTSGGMDSVLHAFRWDCEPAAGGRFYWASWTNATSITVGTYNTGIKARFYARYMGPV